jgi:rod shape-determining protein MreB and related proteins
MSGALAIDVGTARTRVVDPSKGLLVDEPSLAAVDLSNNRLLAYGARARETLGRAAGEVAVVRPVREGQLVDLELTDQIAAWLFERARELGTSHPEVMYCVSGSATGVQQRALERSFKKAGARSVEFIEHTVACGIGSRLRIDEPVASMVVDVGAGTSDIAVMALGGIVTQASIGVGGSDFDDAIRLLCQRSFDLVLPFGAAEAIKLAIGSAWPTDEKKAEVRGRDLGSGRPRTVVLSRGEVATALSEHVDAIVRATVRCITEAPPDLANDLLTRGLYLAGAGGLLDGFPRRLATAAGIPTHLVNQPELVSVMGAARVLRAMRSGYSGTSLGPAEAQA